MSGIRVREAWIYRDDPVEHTKQAQMILPCVLCGEIIETTYTVSTHALEHAPDVGVIASIACETQLDYARILSDVLKQHYINIHISGISWAEAWKRSGRVM